MKKFSDVFKSIRFAKMDPSHDKAHSGGSQDDEEHYTVGEKEWEQQVKHVKKRAMQEEKKDKYDEGEYDREGDMAKSDLRSIIANAKRLHDMIEDADNLPEWVQSKITIAEDYISTVTNYMTAEMNESVADTLAQRHSELRKKSGLPHPNYYKELGKSYDIDDDKERLAKQSEIKKKYKMESYVPSPHSKPVPKRPKGEYERKVEKYLKKKYNKEEVEHLEEMPGANMDTRAVHKHLKKQGWSLSRTSGGHDVFTHPKAKDHIAVPRHKQLKAPLVRGILKASKVNEEIEEGVVGRVISKVINKLHSANAKRPLPQASDRRTFEKPRMEEVEHLEEKNVPTSPEKWAQAKAQAKAKFDVYPSAYANGWASKKYKEMGGGWKSVSEETIDESRKTEIIKKLAKKKPSSEDKFEPNPIMTKSRDDRDH